jgi:hypothetical protein
MAPACLPYVFEVLVDNPDRRLHIRAVECAGLDEPGRSTTQTGSAMDCRGSPPPKGHALDRGSGSHPAAGTNCRQCVEHRAVGSHAK